MNKYWTKDIYDELEKVNDFEHLFPIGLKVIKKMPQPISMVSGPISTGGKGSIEKNLKVFERAIDLLSEKGHNVFHQLPFQGVMIRLGTSWKGQGYCMPLLTEFYQPVFESGYIKTVHFIPGWEKSFGAKWEHEQCGRLGIERIYLPEDFLSCL
ncbi:MAG: hypothetical protein A3H57_03285 [Candidatus Taylorbacteria bacterium RIFCSPLOWO2_02_FULL_43_11]|uniref:Uncharacterized protein n=1 Tax=Candidatus Taylorbacteria bacterium RIFCSPHIGHO2_02_FULL_43_32b TaxID=1802306 RepID=A0A1G2MFH6_9BACT|nr:MAG: hypothetical protein A2743_00795 [Candidatus Taylorbacteria bacterium RIFCSPHIGHO2_01_FULL_43_47]OHA22660.1 MAG: hypothetical protein A3C72_01220 [Candidatus Taylorbacteria bacterium RIFCSPHIGHO2_02_FULL_43_32b]OHA29621.1 MAG: hypothetical protein A3B08_03325 [Candidatus Taylorbacteria bacterium RIFCSPLOWO2_01_FULL_43_44]OHA36128.1 MAG: hypothetical protein A3H57_03285 [Candidatus Taylorbacteria bacterium RIFCSPLOWO2_02_FULL_43_11]